jgi:hypothetical protein
LVGSDAQQKGEAMKANTSAQVERPLSLHWLPRDISNLQKHGSPAHEGNGWDAARQCMEELVHDVLNALQCISMMLDYLSLTQTPPPEYLFIFQQLEHASQLLRERRDQFCGTLSQAVVETPLAGLEE